MWHQDKSDVTHKRHLYDIQNRNTFKSTCCVCVCVCMCACVCVFVCVYIRFDFRCDTQKTPTWHTIEKHIQEYLLCVHVCMCMCVCVCVCVRVCIYTLRFSMWHAKDTYMTYKWTSIWQSDIVSLTPYKSRLRYGNSAANTLHTSIWQSTYLYLTPYCLLLQCVAAPMYVSGTVSVGSIRLVSHTCRDERKTSEKVHTSRPTHV